MTVHFLNRNKVLKRAKNNIEIVEWMLKNDLRKGIIDVNDFMITYSERKSLFDKIEVRTDNVDVFVEDLVKHGIIKITA